MADDKPLSQQYHEAVEAHKKDGMSNADAIRAVADEFGKNVNAVRGAIHQYKTRQDGTAPSTGRSRRRRTASVEDHISSARRSLEDAMALIDQEVEEARAALDAAQARYDEAVASVKDRKADLEVKLKALS